MTGVIDLIPAELVALIDKPWLFALVLAIGAFIGMGIATFAADWRRYQWRKRNAARVNNGWRPNWSHTPPPEPPRAAPQRPVPRDAADQLRIVMGAKFTQQRLLNFTEARVFRDLDRMVLGRNPRWQVMAQVSLGEIIRSEDPDAHACINSKRVDLLVVDEECRPKFAFEYQGGGHYQNDAAARDAVKKEALRRAGISYHEVYSQTTPAELHQIIERLMLPTLSVVKPATAPPSASR